MKTQIADAPPAAGGEGAATAYEIDVILWAEEQARFLREGRFSELDIEHLADEIEDVGRSEERELARRMAVLLARLLKWRLQPEKRSKNWRTTIADQRRKIEVALRATPSLKTTLRDPIWQEEMWLDARTRAREETGLDAMPDASPWSMDEARDPDFWPE